MRVSTLSGLLAAAAAARRPRRCRRAFSQPLLLPRCESQTADDILEAANQIQEENYREHLGEGRREREQAKADADFFNRCGLAAGVVVPVSGPEQLARPCLFPTSAGIIMTTVGSRIRTNTTGTSTHTCRFDDDADESDMRPAA